MNEVDQEEDAATEGAGSEEPEAVEDAQETAEAPTAPEHHAHTGLSAILHQAAESRGIDIDDLASKAGISADQVDSLLQQAEGKIPGASALEGIAGQFLGKKDN